jgi:cyanuric acid amidohydrolase
MQRNSFDVISIPTDGPGDVSGLMALIYSGALEPASILAVLGKTEGNRILRRLNLNRLSAPVITRAPRKGLAFGSKESVCVDVRKR